MQETDSDDEGSRYQEMVRGLPLGELAKLVGKMAGRSAELATADLDAGPRLRTVVQLMLSLTASLEMNRRLARGPHGAGWLLRCLDGLPEGDRDALLGAIEARRGWALRRATVDGIVRDFEEAHDDNLKFAREAVAAERKSRAGPKRSPDRLQGIALAVLMHEETGLTWEAIWETFRGLDPPWPGFPRSSDQMNLQILVCRARKDPAFPAALALVRAARAGCPAPGGLDE